MSVPSQLLMLLRAMGFTQLLLAEGRAESGIAIIHREQSSRICACPHCPERRTLSFVSHLLLTPLVSFDVLRVTTSRGDIIIGLLEGFDQDEENIFKLTQTTFTTNSVFNFSCMLSKVFLQVAHLVFKMTL